MKEIFPRIVMVIVVAAMEAWLIFSFFDLPERGTSGWIVGGDVLEHYVVQTPEPTETILLVVLLGLAALPLLLSAAFLREIAVGNVPPASGRYSIILGLAAGPLLLSLVPGFIPPLSRSQATLAIAAAFVVQIAVIARVYYVAMFAPATRATKR